MKKTFQILTIFIFSSTALVGQGITSSDSLEIVDAYETLFKAIENNDQKILNKI